MEGAVENNEEAALGDIRKLESVALELERDLEQRQAAGRELAAKLLEQSPLDPAARGRLRALARACHELGDAEAARALLSIASSGEEDHQQTVYLEINSRCRRKYRLLRYDRGVRLPELATEADCGFLPCKLSLRTQTSYLLVVDTEESEPAVAIPLWFETCDDVDPLEIDLEPWIGVGKMFRWLPQTRCIVGGDLGARDAMKPTIAIAGPLVVSAIPVRLEEYLGFVDARGENDLIPTFMGDPLMARSAGRWVPLRLAIRPDNDWRYVPAVGVNFDCARQYASSVSLPAHLIADIPTEREWEILARGPDRRLFPWGDTYVRRFANIRIEGELSSGLEQVGKRRTDYSAFGLFDCSGNAEEWCVLESRDGGHQGYAVARGGSFYNPMQASRLASRVVRNVEYRHRKLTFRVVVRPR